MKLKSIMLSLLVLMSSYTFSQNLDTDKLDKLFNTLEKRNEAMGCITISQNGKILYSKAIGYSNISNEGNTSSNEDTHYKIWSITKTYTAVMIFQLIEEGKLSLKTRLDKFFPQIQNAEKITIQHMLSHRSGIFDYVNDTDQEINLRGIGGKDAVAEIIGKLKPNFMPNEDFRYSNSNYLLLGYIIETLDDSTYKTSLANRISARANLKDTHFETIKINKLVDKANTYVYDNHWKPTIEEATYKDHLETADGGIVATTNDMALFIEALFTGKLISKQSLNAMIEGEDFYRLGLMYTKFENKEGFGHTGGWVSESSLFYYPEDQLAISYATNGIVIRKQDILENVLKIYHNKPFAISMNRYLQVLIIFGIGFVMFLIIKLRYSNYLYTKSLIQLGVVIAIIYWTGTFISGFLMGNYSHIRNGVSELDSFYSNSGTFMASIQYLTALLLIPFLIGLYKVCKKKEMSIVPLIPLFVIPISMIGVSLFPFPNMLFEIFANIIIFSGLGPLLAIILWRNKKVIQIWRLSMVSLLFVIVSIVLIMLRSSNPEIIHNYWGIIQRLLFLGWTSWITFLSLYFIKYLNFKEKLRMRR